MSKEADEAYSNSKIVSFNCKDYKVYCDENGKPKKVEIKRNNDEYSEMTHKEAFEYAGEVAYAHTPLWVNCF